MSESEELNKRLMATHIPTSIQLSQCPCQFCPCANGQNNLESTLSETLQRVGTGAVQDHLPSPPGAPSVPLKVDGLRSQWEGGRLLDFIGMRAMLEGFQSWAQTGAERQNLNLQAAWWPAFEFSPSSPVSPARRTLFKLIHTHTHWIYMNSHGYAHRPLTSLYGKHMHAYINVHTVWHKTSKHVHWHTCNTYM